MVEMQDFIVLTLAQVRELLADVEAKADEAYDAGFEHGHRQGYDEGFNDGVADGYDDGFDDGAAYEREELAFRTAEKAAYEEAHRGGGWSD
jgi:flagellar biosynthesis/type III secretory pathway protein FliH